MRFDTIITVLATVVEATPLFQRHVNAAQLDRRAQLADPGVYNSPYVKWVRQKTSHSSISLPRRRKDQMLGEGESIEKSPVSGSAGTDTDGATEEIEDPALNSGDHVDDTVDSRSTSNSIILLDGQKVMINKTLEDALRSIENVTLDNGITTTADQITTEATGNTDINLDSVTEDNDGEPGLLAAFATAATNHDIMQLHSITGHGNDRPSAVTTLATKAPTHTSLELNRMTGYEDNKPEDVEKNTTAGTNTTGTELNRTLDDDQAPNAREVTDDIALPSAGPSAQQAGSHHSIDITPTATIDWIASTTATTITEEGDGSTAGSASTSATRHDVSSTAAAAAAIVSTTGADEAVSGDEKGWLDFAVFDVDVKSWLQETFGSVGDWVSGGLF
ncbi:hypothetical protein CDD80_5764 [Ophiocordyceps camponoti-rufipedis]|uniref:Uncharacterized protein n=1 Tax=Ophiocordyceps camponoti-rufipedis TaxID=2004952 RepID=A0A2C5YT91_9HYPO|nr:hypothetical protein CDD80_5764 [Ophiocordyceps camponoti-rufipedis]